MSSTLGGDGVEAFKRRVIDDRVGFGVDRQADEECQKEDADHVDAASLASSAS